MGRRSKSGVPEEFHKELSLLLEDFRTELQGVDLRRKVAALIPSFHSLRSLGCSLLGDNDADSGTSRIRQYFRLHVGRILNSEEFMVISGIVDYPRRIRELRVEDGWPIISGVTARQIIEEAEEEKGEKDALDLETFKLMGKEDYLLLRDQRDEGAAHRWEAANDLRKSKDAVKTKILKHMQANVGQQITGEELIYIANERSEWARRTRQLRTEEGWPIATKFTGRPDLPVGVYVLRENKRLPPHDRKISDRDRRAVLLRDDHTCQECRWNHSKWNASDARHLEVHHKTHHAKGGSNKPENLVTLCNICHDERHKQEKTGSL